MSFIFDRGELDAALKNLAQRLAADRLAVTIYVVGGGAVMLSVRPDRGGTKDVDTWINADAATKSAVQGHIEQMAAERGWTSDWMNENAKNYIPEAVSGDPSEWEPYIQVGEVVIVLGRADVLLAMKLRAGRPIKDLPDLPSLVAAASVTNVAQAADIFETHYPHDVMKAAARNWLLANLPRS